MGLKTIRAVKRTAADLTVAQRVARAMGPVLGLFLVASALVHYQTRQTAQIYAGNGTLARRTLVAAQGMDASVSEAGLAIRTYVTDRDPSQLERLRNAATGFRRHHQSFVATAQTDARRALGDRVAGSFDRYLANARLLAEQADKHAVQLASFDRELAGVGDLLETRRHVAADPKDRQAYQKLQAMSDLTVSVVTLAKDLLGVVAGQDRRLEATVQADSERLAAAFAAYRTLPLTKDEAQLIRDAEPRVTTLIGLAQEVIALEHQAQEAQTALGTERRTLDGLLADELQRPAEVALEDSGLAMQLGISQAGTVVLVLFAIAVATGLVLSVRTANSITRPLGRILEGVEAIADGRRVPRVGPDQEPVRDELELLADRIDHMAGRLAANNVSRRYVDELTGAIGQFLVVVDAEGRIVRANTAATTLLGYADVELAGRPFDLVLASPLPTGRLRERDVQLQARDGRLVDVLLSAGPLDEEGHAATVYTAIDVTAKKTAERAVAAAKDELARLTRHDELTGLPNRRAFEATLHSALELAKRREAAVAVILLDIDDFKRVNDTFGQEIGDELLRFVSQRLYGCVRSTDVPARYGGDEFAVLLESLADANDAPLVADKILDALQRPVQVRDHEVQISCSIGIGVFPGDGASTADLLKAADLAMYRAKAAGKNRWMSYSAA